MREENTVVAERMEMTARSARRWRVEMPEQDAPDELAAARRATGAFFALLGVSVATWAALVPFAKARLSLDDAGLGTILLAFGCGTIAATLVAAWLVARHGSRKVLVAAAPLACLALPLLAHAPSRITLVLLLFAFGAFVGLLGVAANAQAIAVQTLAERPLMSSFHAMFSVGGLVGAGVCSLLLHLGVPIETCAVVVAAALLLLVATQSRGLVADPPVVRGLAARPRRRLVPPTPVLVVGLMTFALYLSEGAVLDWAAVFLHEVRGYDVATAALGYAAFSVTMAGGRLLGDRIVLRLGPVTVIRFGSAVAAAGFITLVLARGESLGLLGCALIGLGASNVVPTLISASAKVSGPLPTGAALSTVVAMGTTGLIAGPALIGFVAQRAGLVVALGGLAIMLLIVGSAANVVGGAADVDDSRRAAA
jgi:fucose permease